VKNKQNKGRDATPSRPPLDHRPPTGRDATPSRPPLDAQAKRELTATIAAMRGTETTDLIRAIAATEQNLACTRQQLADLQSKLARQHAEFYRQTIRDFAPSREA
jgi:hypothetical protein